MTTAFVVCAVVALSGMTVVTTSVAGAAPTHTRCAVTYPYGTSGWCNLYPGNASQNVKDLGQTTLLDGDAIIEIQTVSASSGQAPRTSSACVTMEQSAPVTVREQSEQCAAAGGVWLTWTGPSYVMNVFRAFGFYSGIFNVQVQANDCAGNGNGDAFYNNFEVQIVG